MGNSAFEGSGSGNAGVKITVQQSNNFVAGEALRLNGSLYVRAVATSSEDSEAIGVVESASGSSFTIVFSGEINLSDASWTPVEGSVYFLSSATEGELTTVPPLSTGTVKKTIMVGTSNEKGIIVNYLGLMNGIGGNDLVELDGVQPIGSIIPYSGNISELSKIPTGWLLCDGSKFNNIDYPELALLLGDSFGTISGNEYTLPDFRGRTPIGVNTNNNATEINNALTQRVIGNQSGQEEHAIGTDEIPSHTHSATQLAYVDEASNIENAWHNLRVDTNVYGPVGGQTVTSTSSGVTANTVVTNIGAKGPVCGNDFAGWWNGSGDDLDYGLVNFNNITVSPSGNGLPHNNMQPYITVNWLIRATAQASAAILTVNLENLADVDKTKSCGISCEGACNSPKHGDSIVFNEANTTTKNNGHGSDKFVITSSSNPNKNVIINGNFDVWQRGTSFNFNTGNTHLTTADRWQWGQGASTSIVMEVQKTTQNPFATGQSYIPSTYSLQTILTDGSTMQSADYVGLNYVVEGYDFRNLWSAKCMTLSFFVSVNTAGTYCVSFRNKDYTQSLVAEYTIDTANVWEWKTITVPLPTESAVGWDFDNDAGLRIGWVLASGSNWHTNTTNQWMSGSSYGTPNQVNSVAVAEPSDAGFSISQVQLEAGSVATPFQQRNREEEISKCQRYYQKSYDLDVLPGTFTWNGAAGDWARPQANGQSSGDGDFGWRIEYPTTFRKNPTVTVYAPYSGTIGWMSPGNSVASIPLGNAWEINAKAGHSGTKSFLMVHDGGQDTNYAFQQQWYAHYTADAEIL